MKKISTTLGVLAICLLLSSCNNQSRSLKTQNQEQKPTVTLIPPYPTKQVLINYTVHGFNTPTDLFYSDFKWSQLVIYSDGQVIIPGTPYKQKTLSKDEINQILWELEALGFYAIKSNQKHDLSDKLYKFENQYQKIHDGLWYCLSINSDKPRELCAYEPFKEFLILEMNNILKSLDNYQPEDVNTYYPDRVLLRVQAGKNPYDKDLPEKTILWTESSLSLETINEKILYAEGKLANKLFTQLGNGSGVVFIQDGIVYTVYLEIILPHNEITNIYEQ